MSDLIQIIKEFFQQMWPAIAMAIFNYEQDQIDHAEKEKELAVLTAKNLQDEKDIHSKLDGESVHDLIAEIDGTVHKQ